MSSSEVREFKEVRVVREVRVIGESFMKYDFDKIIDRSGSGDLKHEVLKARYGRDNLIPLWVADMEFETPSFILDAIKKVCNTLLWAIL